MFVCLFVRVSVYVFVCAFVLLFVYLLVHVCVALSWPNRSTKKPQILGVSIQNLGKVLTYQMMALESF